MYTNHTDDDAIVEGSVQSNLNWIRIGRCGCPTTYFAEGIRLGEWRRRESNLTLVRKHACFSTLNNRSKPTTRSKPEPQAQIRHSSAWCFYRFKRDSAD